MGALMADFNPKFQFYRAELCSGREMVLQQIVDPATHYTIQFGLLFRSLPSSGGSSDCQAPTVPFTSLLRTSALQIVPGTAPMSLLSTVGVNPSRFSSSTC